LQAIAAGAVRSASGAGACGSCRCGRISSSSRPACSGSGTPTRDPSIGFTSLHFPQGPGPRGPRQGSPCLTPPCRACFRHHGRSAHHRQGFCAAALAVRDLARPAAQARRSASAPASLRSSSNSLIDPPKMSEWSPSRGRPPLIAVTAESKFVPIGSRAVASSRRHLGKPNFFHRLHPRGAAGSSTCSQGLLVRDPGPRCARKSGQSPLYWLGLVRRSRWKPPATPQSSDEITTTARRGKPRPAQRSRVKWVRAWALGAVVRRPAAESSAPALAPTVQRCGICCVSAETSVASRSWWARQLVPFLTGNGPLSSACRDHHAAVPKTLRHRTLQWPVS